VCLSDLLLKWKIKWKTQVQFFQNFFALVNIFHARVGTKGLEFVTIVRKAFEFLARVGKTCFCEDVRKTGVCEEEERGRINMHSSERFF